MSKWRGEWVVRVAGHHRNGMSGDKRVEAADMEAATNLIAHIVAKEQLEDEKHHCSIQVFNVRSVS